MLEYFCLSRTLCVRELCFANLRLFSGGIVCYLNSVILSLCMVRARVSKRLNIFSPLAKLVLKLDIVSTSWKISKRPPKLQHASIFLSHSWLSILLANDRLGIFQSQHFQCTVKNFPTLLSVSAWGSVVLPSSGKHRKTPTLWINERNCQSFPSTSVCLTYADRTCFEALLKEPRWCPIHCELTFCYNGRMLDVWFLWNVSKRVPFLCAKPFISFITVHNIAKA